MAQDATLPEVVVAPPDGAEPEPEFSTEPPSRGRRRKQRTSLLAMINAELSAMLFMFALGLWITLILMSSFFPFSGAVEAMEFKGIVITAIAALAALLFAPSVFRFWNDGDRFGSIVAAGLALATVGNWVGWFYHFNLPHQVMQLFS